MTKEWKTALWARMRDAMIEALDAKYELVYVAYDDKLTNEQVAHLVAGDWESFWGSTEDWESESRWHSVKQITEQSQSELIALWRDESNDEDHQDHLTILEQDFYGSQEWEEVRSVIEDRDTSNWVKELASQTGQVLLRIPIEAIDEDHSFSFQQDVTAEMVLDRLEFEHTESNVKEVAYVLANHEPEYHVAMGYWIVGVDVEAIYGLSSEPDTEVEIVDPYLYLGNPFTGSGFVSEKALTGTVRPARADLRTDKGAFGYSIDEIYGGVYASSFEAELRAAPSPATTLTKEGA